MPSVCKRPRVVARILTLLVLAVSTGVPAAADQLTLVWEPSAASDAVGYIVYVGTRPGAHTESYDRGGARSFLFSDARPGQQYCFAVAAYAPGPLVGPKSADVCGYTDAPPLLLDPGDQTSTLGRPVSLGLRGGDPYGQPVTYDVVGLPPGLTFARSTGVIAGIPIRVGFYSVTATITDGLLSASESFGWTVRDGAPPDPPPPPPPDPGDPSPVSADSVAPRAGSGISETFVMRYSDPTGAASLATASLWFHGATSERASSCLIQYDRRANRLSLLDDAGSRWQDVRLGGTEVLHNGQCTVAAEASSATVEGSTLVLRVPVTFTLRFSGMKDVALQAARARGASSGWQTRGSWLVPGAVAMDMRAEALPAKPGAAPSYRVSLAYSRIARKTSLKAVSAWLRPSSEPLLVNSCLIGYDPREDKLLLLGDRGTEWSSATLGSEGTLRNGQCAIAFDGRTTAVMRGDTLTLTFDVAFTQRFDGTKRVYLYAIAADGTASAWETRKAWALQ